jgi:hypothetical protein
LLEMREGSPYSTLAWLRLPPGAPTARAILAHIERLRAIRELQISPEASQRVHQNRLLQLAREAGQTAVYHFKDYELDRRYGTLVALMIETAATVTDEILDLNDRLIGSFFTKAKNKYERAFAEQGKAINDKVRLYAKVGAALVSAREQGRDPYVAIEAIVSWDAFSRSVTEAEQLARDEDFDPLSLVTEHYPQLRRFAPVLLETFEFRPAAPENDQDLLCLPACCRNGRCPTFAGQAASTYRRHNSTVRRVSGSPGAAFSADGLIGATATAGRLRSGCNNFDFTFSALDRGWIVRRRKLVVFAPHGLPPLACCWSNPAPASSSTPHGVDWRRARSLRRVPFAKALLDQRLGLLDPNCYVFAVCGNRRGWWNKTPESVHSASVSVLFLVVLCIDMDKAAGQQVAGFTAGRVIEPPQDGVRVPGVPPLLEFVRGMVRCRNHLSADFAEHVGDLK